MRPSERAAFLQKECGDDAALRAEVTELLRYLPEDDFDTFLDDPPVRLGAPSQRVSDPEVVGPYRVVQRLGEGGFGVVYEVEQTEPIRRRLALKLLKPGMDTREVLDRFENERQTLALMDHPNIARAIDAGAADGQPYFVMELVPGDPITEYCDRMSLGFRARLDLMIEVCRAVQHAHQRGVLHRDLKPSNILVTHVDGKPVPKVIDFGIAKVMAGPVASGKAPMTGAAGMGTPIYMSPEQASTSRLDVDTATDVYSLGVLCYQVLTGHLPYDKNEIKYIAIEDYEMKLRGMTPAAPSSHFSKGDQDRNLEIAKMRGTDPWQLNSTLKGDIDAILLKAIETDRLRRYPTVHEFVQDFELYYRDEPVSARPSTTGYRLRKYIRRHRVALGVVGAVTVALLAAGAGLTWSLLESKKQRVAAEIAREESDAVLMFLSNMLATAGPFSRDGEVTMKDALDAAARGVGQEFEDQPLVEARLRLVMGRAYRELGEFAASREQLGKAQRLYASEIEDDDLRSIAAQQELGLLFRAEGSYEQAESTLTRTLRVRRAALPETDRRIVESLEDLGGLYIMAEENEKAVPLLEEAERLGKPILHESDLLWALVVSDLGLVYQQVGRYEESERYSRMSIELDTRWRGADSPETMLAMVNLAGLYRLLGRYGEAEPLYATAVDGLSNALGPNHYEALRARSNFALFLQEAGKLEAAYPHSYEVVIAKEEAFGTDKPTTLVSRINHALLLIRMGRYDECLESARETRMRIARSIGDDHLYDLIINSCIARSLQFTGHQSDAEALFARTVPRYSQILSPDHWRTGRVKTYYGACLIDGQKYEAAEAQLQDGYRILNESFGARDKRTRAAAAELARLYQAWGQPDLSQQWQLQAGDAQ